MNSPPPPLARVGGGAAPKTIRPKPSEYNVLNPVVSPGGAGHVVRVAGCTPVAT